MGDDDVGLPVADQPRDRAAVLQRRQQLTVVVVEHFGIDAEYLGRRVHLVRATLRTAVRRPIANAQCHRW